MIVRAVLRIVGSVTALVVVYFLLPLDHSSTGTAVTILVIGLVIVGSVSVVTGIILDVVTKTRPKTKRLAYLAMAGYDL